MSSKQIETVLVTPKNGFVDARFLVIFLALLTFVAWQGRLASSLVFGRMHVFLCPDCFTTLLTWLLLIA